MVSTVRYTRSIPSILLAFAASVFGCGDAGAPSGPDAGQAVYLLEIPSPPGDTLGLAFGERAALRVRYRDPQGAVVVRAPIEFTIVTELEATAPAGASLSAPQALTDKSGFATVDVVAGAAPTSFRVRASAPQALPVTFYLVVSDEGFATVEVTPVQIGSRPVAAVELRLYDDGVTCPALSAAAPPESPYPARAVPAFGTAATFSALVAGRAYALLAWGRGADGRVLGEGCVDLAPGQVRPGSHLRLSLAVRDRPVGPAAAYALTSALDLRPLREALVDRSPTWECPLGAAQTTLDCAIDALDDAPDALDCVVVNPGATAAQLQAARGELTTAGCRPETAGGKDSADKRVMAALRAGTPGDQLDALVMALRDLLDGLALESRLVPAGGPPEAPWGTWAEHGLRRAVLTTGGRPYAVELVASPRPVVQTTAALAVDPAEGLALRPHGFTLRLGELLADAFDAEALRAGATTATHATLGSAIVDGAVVGTTDGCAAVSQEACGAAGLGQGCLTNACLVARAAIDAWFEEPFARLRVSDLDLYLEGSAALVDADADVVAETLASGLWSATVEVATGTAPPLTGTFLGAAE